MQPICFPAPRAEAQNAGMLSQCVQGLLSYSHNNACRQKQENADGRQGEDN